MDAARFDALIRALDLGAPRRTVLGGLTAGLGALLSGFGIDADAKKKHKHKKKKCKPCQIKKKGKCKGPKPDGTACGEGKICQGGECVPATCEPACVAPEECVSGVCTCPSAQACLADRCCPETPECFADGICLCTDHFICACPPGDEFCMGNVAESCCLAEDSCDPDFLCMTETCTAGNDFCEFERAFCNNSSDCACVTTVDGFQECVDISGFDEFDLCPDPVVSECTGDSDCAPGEQCADVSCCAESGSIGVCLPLCPEMRAGARTGRGRSSARTKKALAAQRS
jgi:hypothetical protein